MPSFISVSSFIQGDTAICIQAQTTNIFVCLRMYSRRSPFKAEPIQMRKNLIRIRNTVSNHHIMSSFDARFINFNIRHLYQICTNETCYYISIQKVKIFH